MDTMPQHVLNMNAGPAGHGDDQNIKLHLMIKYDQGLCPLS